MFNNDKNLTICMSTINQLVSEIAHSLQQADSIPVRRAIKLGIIHARNEVIRKSYNNHNITDKVLQQCFRLELINVDDGEIKDLNQFKNDIIKRTKSKVPRPVRLINNLPFHSVRTAGTINPIEIPYVKTASSKFYNELPGMCKIANYDYVNEYIYINTSVGNKLNNINYITVESVFEYPHLIDEDSISDYDNSEFDDNEFLLSEDMISAVKKIILETFNPNVIRQTNETPTNNLVE